MAALSEGFWESPGSYPPLPSPVWLSAACLHLILSNLGKSWTLLNMLQTQYFINFIINTLVLFFLQSRCLYPQPECELERQLSTLFILSQGPARVIQDPVGA